MDFFFFVVSVVRFQPFFMGYFHFWVAGGYQGGVRVTKHNCLSFNPPFFLKMAKQREA